MNYRNKANWTLSLVFFAFALMVPIKHYYGRFMVIQLLYFVMEAALVGGIADWFAVTALFKKPLGVAYHTALIPRNRTKIIDAVAKMVEQDLLGLGSLRQKIGELSYSQLGINWLESHPQAQRALVEFVAGYLQKRVLQLDVNHIGAYLAQRMRTELGGLDLANQFQRFGLWALEHHLEERLVAYALEEGRSLAEKPETRHKIFLFLEEQKKSQTKDSTFKTLMLGILESTDSLNLTDAAEALNNQLLESITELENPAHPVRLRFREMLRDSFSQIESQVELREAIAAWQEDVLQRLPLEKGATNLVQSFIKAATTVPGNNVQTESLLAKWAGAQLVIYWANFKQDLQLQNKLNQYFGEIILRLLESEHYLIGEMVRETLNGFSDKDLNRFVEAKAGNDLQWIRINGSIIGGLVGLLIFLFIHIIFGPFVVPVVHNLLYLANTHMF